MSKLLISASAISGITAALFSIKYLLQYDWSAQSCKCAELISSQFPEDWSLEGKLKFISKAASFVAIYLFIVVIKTALARLLTASSNPHSQKDSSIIQTLNKVLQNSLEQSTIFLGALSYWILTSSNKDDGVKATVLVLLFLFGRCMFAVGIFVNLYFPQIIIMRVYSVFISLIISALLILKSIYSCTCFNQVFAFFNF